LKKKAFVLPLVVVVIILLLLIGYALGVVGFEARVQSYRKTYDVYAREAADAGLAQAIYKMNEKLADESIWTENLSSLAESNISLANSNSQYSFKIAGSWPSGYTIESVGTNKNATRRVFATVKLESVFNFAILTEEGISLYPSSTITAFNSSTGATGLDTMIATNGTNTGSVILLPAATVTGDVLTGVGSDPAKAIDNSGTITGETGT